MDAAAVMEGPAGVPPAGVTPNLDHPPNQNGLALFVIVLCSVISTICVLLRAYGRVWLLKRFNAEEALVFSAYGAFWGCVWAMIGVMDTPGYFVHQWDVRMKELIPMTYLVFVMGNTYVVVLALLKAAMLLEWSRILVPRGARTRSVFWWSCMVMIGIQAAACIGLVIALNLQCIPHRASWDFTITDAKCFPLYNLQLGSGIIYLATDVIMFFMPQHLIWSLQLSWKKKLGVSIVFGLGLLACVAAAFRLKVTISNGSTKDATYSIGALILWVMAEMTIGFFVTCTPTLPKILQETGVLRKIKKVLGLTKTGHTNQNSSYGDTTKKGRSVLASANRGAIPAAASNAYRKIDEDGVPLGDLKHSESTEYLRHEEAKANQAAPGGRGFITRTTRVQVDETVDPDYARREAHNKQAWAM